jgi:acetyl-CoA synthetase
MIDDDLADGRSSKASRQDDEWRSWVVEQGGDLALPFAEHQRTFRRIYAERDTGEGPPRVWEPKPDGVGGSNLGELMARLGIDTYAELHAWSVEQRGEFWRQVIERLGIVFAEPPREILDLSGGPEEPRWLPGAKLNIAESCFTAPATKEAVISGREGSAALTQVTYGELAELAARVAGGLRARGLGPRDAVGFYLPMTVECVAAYLGAVQAGCCVVSIASSFSVPELQRRLEIGDCKAVITVGRFLRAGREHALYENVCRAEAPPAIVIRASEQRRFELRPDDLTWEDLLTAEPLAAPEVGDPSQVTNILFSSGTTGVPKAIPWTHLTPIKCAMDGHFHQDIGPQDVVAWPTDIGWMMGPWLIYASLLNGAAMALWEGAPTGGDFGRFVEQAGVTMLGVVPSLVRAWRTSGTLDDCDWRGIRVFSSTGEPSNREDYLWLMSRAAYRAPVIEYCGGTEIGGGYIAGTVVQPACPATFTTPCLGLDFEILDPHGQPVVEGEAGELFIVPPSIGLSQALVNADHHDVYYAGCPSGQGGRVLRRHGDEIGRLARGFFSAEGRADDTMNLGGIKISSIEIERVLAADQTIHEAAAVAVPESSGGPDRLIVFAVLATEADLDLLRGELNRRLTSELNPLFRIHELRKVETLPRTASNKLMRRELRARCLDGESGG